ncbi:MAG: peroxiredoxin family protein [Brevefilum sp.]
MAQLRHDFEKFSALNTRILVMVPNGLFMIKRSIKKNSAPFTILMDKGSKVAQTYNQEQKFFSLGTPTVILVEQGGKIAYTQYADSIIAEPDNEEPLALLAQLNI